MRTYDERRVWHTPFKTYVTKMGAQLIPKSHRVDVALPKKMPVGPSDVVLDLGAHVGSYTAWAGIAGAHRVVAVEPHPSNVAILRENTEDLPNVQVIEAAIVGPTFEYSEVLLSTKSDPDGLSHSLIKRRNHDGTIAVRALKLDEYMLADVTVLKVDVEGVEYQLGEFWLAPKLAHLCIDFHRDSARPWKDEAWKMCAAITRAGFECVLFPSFVNQWAYNGLWRKQ